MSPIVVLEVVVPALPAVPNVMKFTVEGTTPSHPWVNVFHYGYTGTPPTGPDCANFASTLLTSWVSEFTPLMLTSATVQRVTCIDLSSSSGAGGEDVAASPGSRGTAEVPGAMAVLVSKHIARRFRGGHARSYILAGLSSDLADTSHWAAGLVTAVDGAYSGVQTTMNGHTETATTISEEVVVSYITTDPGPPPHPVRRVTPLVDAIVSHATQSEVAIQRRRIGR